ncbi:MAG: hypothetical protein WCQ47_06470, partial [bacterium]
TTNDFKNFKADQFQYYHLPYEEGNFDQTRVDLVSTYPVVDDVKKFLKDEKYGYNLKAMNVDVLEKGYLTAQSYVSDKGVVIILRNTGTHEFPMKHDFGKEIPREIDKRKMAYENLHVIFDSYETEYNTSNRANLYKPNESLLFNKYDFQDDVLELERNLKPYEVIVLATVDKGELQELRGKYIKAILAEDMSISYKDKTTSEIVDLWLLRLPSEGNKVKAPNVFNKILVEDGLLEWMHNDNSNPKRKEQISFLINITNAFQNSSFNRKERTVIDYYKASSTGFASPVKVETFNKRLLNYYENAFSSKIEEKEFLDDVVKKVIDYIILKDNLGNEELDILLLSDENDKSLLNYMIEEAKKGNDGYKYKLALVDLMFDLNLPKIVSATPYFARYNEFKLESAKDITIKITIDELEKERKKIEEKLSLDRGFIK